jgi:hypothetical protein
MRPFLNLQAPFWPSHEPATQPVYVNKHQRKFGIQSETLTWGILTKHDARDFQGVADIITVLGRLSTLHHLGPLESALTIVLAFGLRGLSALSRIAYPWKLAKLEEGTAEWFGRAEQMG